MNVARRMRWIRHRGSTDKSTSPLNDRNTPARKKLISRSRARYRPTVATIRSSHSGKEFAHTSRPTATTANATQTETKTSLAHCCLGPCSAFVRLKGGMAATDHEFTQRLVMESAHPRRKP